MLIDKKVNEFLEELKSDSPAPGGGSAAALVGAIGAALGVMVGNLTVNSDKYQEVHTETGRLMQKLEERLASLERYIDEDTNAFNQVMAAYKLPKATAKEKERRTQAIQTALQDASKLPLEVAKVSLEVLELSLRMLAIGNRNAASDAAVAGRMAHAAMWSAIYNVRINLASIKDADFLAEMSRQITSIIEKSEVLLNQLVNEADEKI